jgi:NAD(P)-dependent dehydrogenase (short-subunit alcohol dehydrogenase family)
MNFKDTVVIITGGSQGFGKALAAACAAEGAQVIIASNTKEILEKSAEELGVDHYLLDVTSVDSVQACVQSITEKYGRIDIWVNNAGIQIAPSPVEKVDIKKLHALMDINFFGYFYGCQAVLPKMKELGSGVIININSTAGLSGKPGISAYSASKFAVKGLTESLREELKDTDIRVYGIFPGGMQTEIYKEKYPADFSEYMDVEYAIKKVMGNLQLEEPELDLIIRRPTH